MSCCACCCFYPKYKRKVDNIYPRSYELPLVKIEVEKLQYYVKQHPEKLSKIGEYLYQNLKWGLNGTYKNRNYVKNTVEAVDKILLVITPQNLNYYAANYLKIIQKLLEQGAPTTVGNEQSVLNSTTNVNIEYLEYQKLAADLFRKFCEKEAANQSTTNYNLNYDTFVCQFSSMCYNNNKDENARAEIRSSGLQCLATMVKRLVPDDSLRATYLWENMNKIVPALLYIMQESFTGSYKTSDEDNELNDEQKLVRYLDGDFFEHSRNMKKDLSNYNDFDYDGGEIKINKDLDSIKVEFNRKLDDPYSKTEAGSVIGSGKSSSKSSQSDENGAMLHRKYSSNIDNNIIDPDHEAKMLLKHLACKADYTTISKIVKPILDYLDTNKAEGWQYIGFVRCIFLILMYNVKQQHAIVIKELIKHLDSHINSSAKLKCQIIGAISTCIRTAAMHSVGTAGQIIEIFTYLIKHLKFSVEKTSQLRLQLLQKNKGGSNVPGLSGQISNKSVAALLTSTTGANEGFKIQSDINEEQTLQTKIIDAMGQFTINLPDYSKNEVVTLIVNQITSQQFNYTDLTNNNNSNLQQNAKDQLNTQLRAKYFECLHEICTKYKPTQLFSAFTSGAFLEDILRLTLVADWASSRKAHEIIQHLFDKYQTLNRLKKLKPSLFNDFSRGIASINSQLSKSTTSNLFYKEAGNNSTVSLNKTVTDQAQASAKSSLTSLSKQTRNQTFLSQLDLTDLKNMTSREDISFMRRNGRMLLGHLNENLFLLNNRRENFESIYVTVCLIIMGLYNEKEFLIDLIRFGFHIQELALLNYEHPVFTFNLQCNVHKFACAYFLLLAKSSHISELYEYCSQICEKRKKRGLYHYIFPEYILLETPTMTDSGIHSTRTSMTELEVEFKRDLQISAKEYYNSIDEHQKNKINESINETVETNKKDSSSTINDNNKMAPWLFCKKKIAEILEKAGLNSESLFNQNKDFSLSLNYLQSNIKTVQTALKFRSPYSNSFDSLSNIRQELSIQNIASQGHSRINSKSGPGIGNTIRESPSFQNGNTPRRSLDNESYMDDDTSYDSMSQVSVDQNYDKLFYIDPNSEDNNQLTVDSINYLKQQDLSSFETIKRVLSNGNNTNRTSAATSLAAGSGANGTIISPSGVSSSSITKNVPIRQQSIGGFINENNNSSADDQESNKSTETLENSMKIINDFKQKPFDEIKQIRLRSNQLNLNHEKYQQVFDSISKEITVNKDQTNLNQITNGLNVHSNNSSIYGSNCNLNESLGNNSSSSANANGAIYKESNYQQRMVPLNDIEFPQLFMY